MDEIKNILQSMANHFVQLADEIERRDHKQQCEINSLREEVERNKQTLRKVANVIIGELG